MKMNWLMIRKYSPWLFAMLAMDLFFCLLLWVADVQAFVVLSCVLSLGTVLFFCSILFLVLEHEKKISAAWEQFVLSPDEEKEEQLLAVCSKADALRIRMLGEQLRLQQQQNQQLFTRVADYEEYVEAWAHETKTPISLLTMLLDNHREELAPDVAFKLDYIRNGIQKDVNQMLYFARLKGKSKDYLWEMLDLKECMLEILEDDKPLLEEKKIQVELSFTQQTVYSDYRGLRFLLSQIISNAIKYTNPAVMPKLMISDESTEEGTLLFIRDNGIGVRESDLPYIFEKGFTGNSGENRKRATGMGLYLAGEIAKDLKLSLKAESKWGEGFTMRILFVKVDRR